MLAALVVASMVQLSPSDALRMAADARASGTEASQEIGWQERVAADPTDDLAALGLAYLSHGAYRFEEAEQRFAALVEDDGTPPPTKAWAAYGLGLLDVFRGRFGEAYASFEAAGTQARGLADTLLVVRAYSGRAGAATRLYGVGRGLAIMDSAAVWVRPDSPDVPFHVCNRVGVDRSVTDEQLAAAVAIAERLDRPELAGRCLFQTMVRWTQRGVTDSVMSYAGRARDRLTDAGDLHGLASAHQWAGFYTRSLGLLALAENHLNEAIRAGTASQNEPAVAWSWVNLAGVAASLGSVNEGLRYVERATAMLEVQGDLVGLATTKGFEGQLWSLSRRHAEAERAYREALEMAEQLGNVSTVLAMVRSLGSIALLNGRLEEAEGHIARFEEIVDRNEMVGWAVEVPLLKAELAVHRGELQRADSLLGIVRFRERTSTREAAYLNRVAQVRALSGRVDEAVALATEAADILDGWRARTDDARLRLHAFQREDGGAGIATVVDALSRAGRYPEAFALSERRRARELLDQVVRGDAYASRVPEHGRGETVTLAELQAGLDAGTALLSITAADGEPTSVLTISADEVTSSTGAPLDELRPVVTRLTALVEAGASHEDPARQLAESIYGPALAALPAGIRRVLVVAEGELQRVPLDLLPADSVVALERYAFVTAPSATIAHRLRTAAFGMGGGRVLALGDPSPLSDNDGAAFGPTNAMPRLPGARREARLVGRFGRESVVRLDDAASEGFLKSQASEVFDVVHIAAHAYVDPHTNSRTAIALAADDDDDGLLTPGELGALPFAGSLVVLSTCTSGDGVVVRGEGLQGLTAPILGAGARAVLATHWRVADDAILPLVDAFYGGLADGLAAADALQAAKSEARASGAPASVWAAFTLVGDGGTTVSLRRPRSRQAWWGATALVFVLLGAGWVLRHGRRPTSTV